MSLNWSAEKAENWDKIDLDKREGLIFGTMFYGINPVTEDNYREFYRRHVMFYHSQGWETFLTLEDCHNAVGLGSNASPITKAAFNKKLVECLNAWADALVRRAEREASERTD